MASEARSCRAALNQATVRWPGRRKASDGILSSDAHKKQNPTSDHDHGNAFDLTNDPYHGVECEVEALRLVALARHGVEKRVKYVIWNRRIASAEHGWRWRPYDGDNPHDKHMHVSIFAKYRDDTSPWWDREAKSNVTAKPEESDDMTADDKKWLADQFKAIGSRIAALEDRVDRHAVTILRGPDHPSLTKILDAVKKDVK